MSSSHQKIDQQVELSPTIIKFGSAIRASHGVGISITDSHSTVEPGGVFVAVRGAKFNGEDFIPQAIEKGAKFVIVSRDYLLFSQSVDSGYRVIPPGIDINFTNYMEEEGAIIATQNPRLALSYLAFCLHPDQPENIVAVTGTNGKTSTCYFFAQISAFCGFDSAVIGTLGLVRFKGKSNQTLFDQSISVVPIEALAGGVLTTPNPILLHTQLQELAHDGITHIAIEASSHGLDQYRLDFVKLTGAGFTNLSQDHLDYHQNMSEYYNAKKALFSRLQPKSAVLNGEIAEYEDLSLCAATCGFRILSYGKAYRDDDLKILSHSNDSLVISIFNKTYRATCVLGANFQIDNLMCAIGLAISTGMEITDIIASIPHLQSPPGRMDRFEFPMIADQGSVDQFKDQHSITPNSSGIAEIYIDYAHTPDGLKLVLEQLQSGCLGRLLVVFGCGGNRDAGKRAIMGAIAYRCADITIVTDDNPRHEDPAMIRQDILSGCDIAGCSIEEQVHVDLHTAPLLMEIAGRDLAIHYAIGMLRVGDRLLIAGKGHETFQIVGDSKIPHSDRACVESIMMKS